MMLKFFFLSKIVIFLFYVNSAVADNSVVKAIDPSDMKSRIDLRNEYRENQGGGYTNYLVPRFEYAISKSFSVRLETPLITSAASSPTIRDTDAGYGDTRLEGRYRLYRSDNWLLFLESVENLKQLMKKHWELVKIVWLLVCLVLVKSEGFFRLSIYRACN